MEPRSGSVDVIFISYDEPQADEHYRRLLSLAPWAKRIHGVVGIGNAYRAAGELASTGEFFAVDGDAWVLDSFPFQVPAGIPPNTKCLWNCRNAVNGLVGLNGSVKLLNKRDAATVRADAIDYFGSMSGSVVSFDEVAAENRFNSSPYAAWRAGFRECAKLAGGVIAHTDVGEQLRIWQSVGADKEHGAACILGARLGAAFGAMNWESDVLGEINNPNFLSAEYSRMLAKLSGHLDADRNDSWAQPQPRGSARLRLSQ